MKYKINWLEVIWCFIFIISVLICISFHLLLTDYLLGLFWNKIYIFLINVLVLIFNLCILITLLKLFKQITNHQKVFDIFKKKDISNVVQIMIGSLEKMPYELDISKVKNGIDVRIEGLKDIISIRTIDGSGILVGKRSDKIWKLSNKEVINPFPDFGICYLIKNFDISYLLDDIFVGSISEIVFKLENQIINQTNYKR